jgi:hypothetical protein
MDSYKHPRVKDFKQYIKTDIGGVSGMLLNMQRPYLPTTKNQEKSLRVAARLRDVESKQVSMMKAWIKREQQFTPAGWIAYQNAFILAMHLNPYLVTSDINPLRLREQGIGYPNAPAPTFTQQNRNALEQLPEFSNLPSNLPQNLSQNLQNTNNKLPQFTSQNLQNINSTLPNNFPAPQNSSKVNNNELEELLLQELRENSGKPASTNSSVLSIGNFNTPQNIRNNAVVNSKANKEKNKQRLRNLVNELRTRGFNLEEIQKIIQNSRKP